MAIFSAIAAFATAAFNAVASSFLVASVGFSAASAIGFAVGSIVAGAVAIGVQRLLAPKISIPRSEIQAVINQMSAPRRVYVGKNLAGGIRAFFDVKSGVLYQLVLVAHGPITSFDEFRVDGQAFATEIDADPWWDDPGFWDSIKLIVGDKADFLLVQTRDGSAQGGNYDPLINNFASWTVNHRLENQATFLVAAKAPSGETFSKVFPKSYNTSFQWVIRGQAIFDPRDTSTAYSDNAALVTVHYLTHEDGYRLDAPEVDWDSVSAMADVCDIAVPQLDGSSAPNLRLWGYWTLDEDPISVLDRMHGSSGIRAYETQDGRIGLIGGSYGTPACTLTAKDIRQIRTSAAISERKGYNVLRVFIVSDIQNYEMYEVDAWRDNDRLLQEGEISKEYRLEMCPNLSQGRRLSKGKMHDDNRAEVEIVTNLVGLKARYPKLKGQRHTILLDYRPEDGSGRVIQGEYEVLNHEFDPIALECRIELAKVDRASEAWTPSEEGTPVPPLPSPNSDAAPDISATVTQRVIEATSGNRQAVLEVNAVPIPNREDIRVQAQYRPSIFGEFNSWRAMSAVDYTAQSLVVEDGVTYEVRARFQGVFDGVQDWTHLGMITIQVDSTPPGQPSDLIPSNGSGYVHLSWRNPNGSFYRIRIYRNTVLDFGSASLVGTVGGGAGQISEFQDHTITATTDYFYWVAAANVSGVEGSPAGPASITTT